MNLKLKRTPGLYLVGFMGSGKSTIGRALAERLGWAFADIDEDIERQQGVLIGEIFERQGEPEFRRIERDAIAARVSKVRASRPTVLALGGGAFAVPGNAELLRANGVTIWLDCPIQRIKERIASQNHRPLARDPVAFEELYEARRQSYAKADYRVAIHSDDPAAAVEEILSIPGLL
jgi:shikimate kinase